MERDLGWLVIVALAHIMALYYGWVIVRSWRLARKLKRVNEHLASAGRCNRGIDDDETLDLDRRLRGNLPGETGGN